MGDEIDRRAAALKKTLRDLGWDQRVLAADAEIHFTTLNKILHGNRRATGAQLDSLEKAVQRRLRQQWTLVGKQTETWDEVIRLDGLSATQLLEKAETTPWRRDVLYAARDLSDDLPKLTTVAAEAMLQAFRSRKDRAAGLLANLLTIANSSWERPRVQFLEMERLVRRQMRHGDVSDFYPVQIMASVVSRTGGEEVGRSYLRMSIAEERIRAEEWTNTTRYYCTAAARYQSYVEHRQQRPEGTALRHWDLPSLMEDLKRAPLNFAINVTAPVIRESLRGLAAIDFHLARALNQEVERRCAKRLSEQDPVKS